MAKVLKNLLTDYGYNLVALPKTDLTPLQLLFKTTNGLGSVNSTITKLFEADECAPPQLLPDAQVADITGSAAITYDAQTGINVLESLLQKLNLGKANTKASVDGNHNITISYQNVIESKVDLLDLDKFITGSEPNVSEFGSFREKLEHSELYVINAVLKSSSFTVTMTDKDGQKVNVSAAVKGIIDVSADVSRSKDNAITLSNPAGVTVVFGFKAQRILYDEKKWWQLLKPDAVKFRIIDQQGEVLRDESDLPTLPLSVFENGVDI